MTRGSVDSINEKKGPTAEEVFEAIHAVMHVIRSEQYRVLRDGLQELSHMEGKILGFFATTPGATLSELVERFSRDKGQLARLIKGLKKQGLLSAHVDPSDRRSVRLRPTRQGMIVHRALEAQLKRLTTVAARGLSAKDRAEVVRLLTLLRTNMKTC